MLRSVGAILLVVAAFAVPSISSAQKLYKWTDENGVVRYSDSLPPGYGSREYAKPEYENPDQRLELIESQIKRTEAYLVNLRKRLADLQADASEFKPYSTREDAPEIPESLARDMSRTTASIAGYEKTLVQLRADQEALKKQFDADKSFDADIPRLIEVKGE